MPDKKKIVLPIVAALGLVLLLWLAFHDRSGPPGPVKSALAAAAESSGSQERTSSSSRDNST
jgi:hypothetical protein